MSTQIGPVVLEVVPWIWRNSKFYYGEGGEMHSCLKCLALFA